MKSSLLINIQSWGDIITNSSTEVYTQATNKTIDTIKQIINLLLPGQNCDDLFDIKLRSKQYQEMIVDGDYEPSDWNNKTEDEWIAQDGNGEDCPQIYVEILPKNKDLFTVEISQLFNKLQDTYRSNEYMC